MLQVDQAAAYVRGRILRKPRVALVLGSGLGGLADVFEAPEALPFSDIPGMPDTHVLGHAGRLVAGSLEGVDVIAMQGRVHPYEGHPLAQVVLGVRVMLRLGADTLIVTNATGGLRLDLAAGTLLAITDHLNLTGQNCLVGANDASLGPRFSDMSAAYDPALVEVASEVARAQGYELARGVYAGVMGPSYETPAEVRMLAQLGASVVGMSTVQEVIAARHMNARVLGISCVTNPGAGLTTDRLDHTDVERIARASAAKLAALVTGVIARIRDGA
ncbi:MAG TPA: purine-nucleoside phosphorylase [Polyangiales bacterium]|nr:purine-nucleoside phosphorylase [Polyangiales bacterium]